MSSNRSRLPSLLAIAALALPIAGACGSGDEVPGPSGHSKASTSAEAVFDEVPVHPLADPVGSRSAQRGIVEQSYRTRNTTKEALFRWYGEHLDGWNPESAPAPTGASGSSWKATWLRDERRLVITASDAPTLGDSKGDPTVQYSLSLEPRA
jgi:hypothetical protein